MKFTKACFAAENVEKIEDRFDKIVDADPEVQETWSHIDEVFARMRYYIHQSDPDNQDDQDDSDDQCDPDNQDDRDSLKDLLNRCLEEMVELIPILQSKQNSAIASSNCLVCLAIQIGVSERCSCRHCENGDVSLAQPIAEESVNKYSR